MKLVNKGIGKLFLKEMKSFVHLKVIVAYFSPDIEMEKSLQKIDDLEIVVSSEFSAINPYSLENLENKKNIIRYLPSDTVLGKLHSKVYFGERKDGSKLMIITSANFTHRGMFSNCETSIVLDTKVDDFENGIIAFQKWYSELKSHYQLIDYEVAKKIYNNRPPLSKNNVKSKGKNYWILKTTSGGDKSKDHWSEFNSENVIAIGWGEKISGDPLTEDKLKVIDEIRKKYPGENAPIIYRKIMNFLSIEKDDFVVIMRGYAPNQSSNVYLYGIARITEKRGVDLESNWWIYKHSAKIFKIEAEFPVDLLKSTFQKGSLLQAIHSINKKSVIKLMQILEKKYNIKISL